MNLITEKEERARELVQKLLLIICDGTYGTSDPHDWLIHEMTVGFDYDRMVKVVMDNTQ